MIAMREREIASARYKEEKIKSEEDFPFKPCISKATREYCHRIDDIPWWERDRSNFDNRVKARIEDIKQQV